MKTAFMLFARYDGLPIIPVETVCKDFFAPLTPEKFLRKTANGEIPLPIVRMETKSQKTAKGVHLADLAAYLDKMADAARKEAEALAG